MTVEKIRSGGASGLRFWLGRAPSQVLAVLSCAFLFFMMLLTFIDVAGRYLFASPLPAAYEIVAFTMPCIIFCALPSVNLREGHVTIDLLDHFIPERWQRWQRFIVLLLSAAITAFIAWRLAQRAYDHWRFNEVTDELYLRLWPFSLTMAILSLIAALVLLIVSFNALSGNSDQAESDTDGITLLWQKRSPD